MKNIFNIPRKAAAVVCKGLLTAEAKQEKNRRPIERTICTLNVFEDAGKGLHTSCVTKYSMNV